MLSVILGALSVGYYVGGRLSDKYPRDSLFYTLIAASGASVILLRLLTLSVLPWLGSRFGITEGPLIVSMVLFFLPALILGTLSPFAIRLQQVHSPSKGTGTIAGEIFFWSTLGSIAGSLLTGFVLIPHFGVSHIIFGTAVLLLTLGLIPLLILRRKHPFSKPWLPLAVFLLMLIALMIPGGLSKQVVQGKIQHSQDGLYEKITVYDGEFAGRPTRFFEQDRSLSGAMFLDSDELVFDYTRYFNAYKLFNTEVKNALVIGGGAYSIPKALLSELPKATVDVSEIEPSLHTLARQYFRLPDDNRLTNYTADGRRVLQNSTKKYDLIFSDVYYSLYSIPTHFTTEEFFKNAHEQLNDNGVFVANLIGNLSRQEPSFILSEMRTFQAAFPNSYFFATNSPSSLETQNIMFVGYKGDKKIDFSGPGITEAADPFIKSLAARRIDPARFELTSYPKLTDNYAPVETLIAPALKRSFSKAELDPGEETMAVIAQQLRYGPRFVGAPGHKASADFILAEMQSLFPGATKQTWQHPGLQNQTYDLQNIIGRTNPENPKRIVLGTHYDSKRFSDLDKNNPGSPVPGANDSGSGVAVLLELARIVKHSPKPLPFGIDFVFFDGEEGDPSLPQTDSSWEPLGSTYFAKNLPDYYPERLPESALIVDMVCDKNLTIKKEKSSTLFAPKQVEKFWNSARTVDSNVFKDITGGVIRDDHTPLNKALVPSMLVIDLDYPAFHTGADTLDKCSAKSLTTVIAALQKYLYSN